MNENVRYVLFGAGEIGRQALCFLGSERIVCFCDNNTHIKGETKYGIPIVSAYDLKTWIDENVQIIVATEKPKNIFDISKQLWGMGLECELFEKEAEKILREEIREYEDRNSRREFEYAISKEYLISSDRYRQAGTVDSYFWQDLWAAKRIFKNAEELHYDIGSRLDGFIAHLLSFGKKVKMIDIRPLPVSIPGLEFQKADATEMKTVADHSIKSLSALCSLEHFGLGRYGDPIDPEACFKTFAAIQKKLAANGHFYMSVPIGKEHLEFNAHRVFSPYTILKEFRNMHLVEFSTCYKDQYEENISVDKYADWNELGGERFGLFHFVKN